MNCQPVLFLETATYTLMIALFFYMISNMLPSCPWRAETRIKFISNKQMPCKHSSATSDTRQVTP
ncbi:MAG: hypothetical protein A2521_16355 [Deltaproteobacteria bacterium RIFOXYD12_FULL_57_12]|nr:MAG: hypothetical protein A2521_16355 [Deltaproteobacteria bacterium RIFOXYD12_FULL_57_12]